MTEKMFNILSFQKWKSKGVCNSTLHPYECLRSNTHAAEEVEQEEHSYTISMSVNLTMPLEINLAVS